MILVLDLFVNSNFFQTGLQYMIAFVVITRFTYKSTGDKGFLGYHETTPACDQFENIKGIDSVLGFISSVMFWMCMLPCLYTLAIVLVSKQVRGKKKTFSTATKVGDDSINAVHVSVNPMSSTGVSTNNGNDCSQPVSEATSTRPLSSRPLSATPRDSLLESDEERDKEKDDNDEDDDPEDPQRISASRSSKKETATIDERKALAARIYLAAYRFLKAFFSFLAPDLLITRFQLYLISWLVRAFGRNEDEEKDKKMMMKRRNMEIEMKKSMGIHVLEDPSDDQLRGSSFGSTSHYSSSSFSLSEDIKQKEDLEWAKNSANSLPSYYDLLS
jgi:hypothetical protein